LNPQVAASQVNVGDSHGVVGYTGTAFSGTDTIYHMSNGNVLQCLCTTNGQGYQTKWIQASLFSESDISKLQTEGWEYFADAGSWGLSGSYVAKTSQYACINCTPTPAMTQTPTPTPTGTLTPTPTPTAGPTATPTPGPSSSSSSTTNTTVENLAKTGNFMMIFALFIAGLIFFVAGIVLKRLSK